MKLGCKLGVKVGTFDGSTVFVVGGEVGWEVGLPVGTIMFEKYISLRKPELISSPAKHQILRW